MIISIEQAIQELESGNVVAIPTETVYGLGAIATSREAVKKIFAIKKRPSYNPLICHIGNIEQLSHYAFFNEYEKELFQFWPGPLTIILQKKKTIPSIVTANSEYCAFRIPSHPIFLQILNQIQKPIAAPSANPSGKVSAVTSRMVQEYFGNSIAGIVEGGQSTIGLESTVIRVTGYKTIEILRPGKFTEEFFLQQGYKVQKPISKIKIHNQKGLLSPGLLSKHYATNHPLILLSFEYMKEFTNSTSPKKTLLQILTQSKMIPNSIMNTIKSNNNIGFLIYGNHFPETSTTKNLSKEGNLIEIANNLFLFLKQMDEQYNILITFSVPNQGIGTAINDRLTRAADWKIPFNLKIKK